jgi:hypothetical protein
MKTPDNDVRANVRKKQPPDVSRPCVQRQFAVKTVASSRFKKTLTRHFC